MLRHGEAAPATAPTLRPRTPGHGARGPGALAAGISLEVDPEETPEIPPEKRRLLRALGSLLSNAVKYTERGDRVPARTGVRDNHAEPRATDTDIGMTVLEQANLFTEYNGTRTAQDSGIAGHSIGLPPTRRIAVAHRPQIGSGMRL